MITNIKPMITNIKTMKPILNDNLSLSHNIVSPFAFYNAKLFFDNINPQYFLL